MTPAQAAGWITAAALVGLAVACLWSVLTNARRLRGLIADAQGRIAVERLILLLLMPVVGTAAQTDQLGDVGAAVLGAGNLGYLLVKYLDNRSNRET